MKLNIVNRQGDAFPVLELDAENDKEGQQLKELMGDMEKVQGYGIRYGVATNGYPPCGQNKHHFAIDGIAVRVILGQGDAPTWVHKNVRDNKLPTTLRSGY